MKLIVGMIVVIGVVALVVYYTGGYSSFDPTQQGKTARAAITTGMTWKQVVGVAEDPREFRSIVMKIERIGGEDVETFKPSARNRFNPKTFPGYMSDNQFSDGFIFEYRFSEQVAFAVEFDGTGTAVAVNDLTTMADLLQTR